MRRKQKRENESEVEPGDSVDGESTANAKGPRSLEDQVLELTQLTEDLNGRVLRAQADYQNLRRRAQQDLESSLKRTMQPLVEELLFVLDFLDMALASPATNEETKNLVMGVQMTRSKFVQALENSDVKTIPTEGLFDPKIHEASEAREAEGVEPGSILSTVRRGYTWQGHVLRHAQVVVVQGDRPAVADETPSEGSGTEEPEFQPSDTETGAEGNPS